MWSLGSQGGSLPSGSPGLCQSKAPLQRGPAPLDLLCGRVDSGVLATASSRTPGDLAGLGREEGNRKSDALRTRSTAHGRRLSLLEPPRQGAKVQCVRAGGGGQGDGPLSHSNGPAPSYLSYSLAFTYQTGLRGVLRSFVDGLINLRGNRRFWSFLTLRDRVSWDSPELWSSCSVGHTLSGCHSPFHSLRSCPLHPFLGVGGSCFVGRVHECSGALPASPPRSGVSLCRVWLRLAGVSRFSLICPGQVPRPPRLCRVFRATFLSCPSCPHLSGLLVPDAAGSERGAPVSPPYPTSSSPPRSCPQSGRGRRAEE